MPGLLKHQKQKQKPKQNRRFMLNMGGRPFQYFLGHFVLLLWLGSNLRAGDAKVGCIGRERQALLLFKQGVVDDFGMLSSWGTEEGQRDCCKWQGVVCNNQTGHVIGLHLPARDGMGFHQCLGGRIDPSLAELQHLKHLNLSFNLIQGNLPTQLGNLSNLQSLDIGYNLGMTCENLDWLSHLSSLTHLDLSWVNLSQAIHWPQAINKMPSLTELYLSYTKLPRIIPTSISHINSSTSLAVLDLSTNSLTSSIYPWLFNFSSNLVHLYLTGTDLHGSIPDAFANMVSLESLDLSWNQLNGEIPQSLISSSLVHPDLSKNELQRANTTALAYLDLSRNNLEGEIPKSFSISLVRLDLSRNQLRGSIPASFGNMSALAYLDLSRNQLEGEIPKSFSNLCSLQSLLLPRNNLTGLLANGFLACSNDTLEDLDLSRNQFRGSFPDLSGFSKLRVLYLEFNQLNGTLPESIGQLAQLEELNIPSNSFQGTVSSNHLFGLSKLQYLDFSFNSLTFNISFEQVPQFQAQEIKLAFCKLGPRFPNWLRTQKGLQVVDISASGISDIIPNWFSNLTSNLVWLNISNNHISGALPNLQATPSLGMDMSSNCLEGSIPQPLFNAGWLDLSKNLFSGSISLLCGPANQSSGGLLHLDLSNNLLSGELPDCWGQWKELIVLNLEHNNLSGRIKNSIGSLQQIQTLHLRNNSLSGELPLSLKNCKYLHLIDLGKNKLSGKIPAWIGGSLSSLIIVNLKSNQFNGSIPLNLCHLKKIQMLDLSNNNLSGTIPNCLNNFTAMAQKGNLVIAYEEISGALEFSYMDNTLVQWKGKELEYKKTLGLLKSIDFSSNKLIGEIPTEVTDLVELVSLNLSRNNLTGPIPSMIGQLKSLDFLDLSQNELHGGIPISLSQITGLSVLDLSDNILSGKIPLGTQLQSFNASTYEGNPGLCGPPLLQKCPRDETRGASFIGPSNEVGIQDDANDVWFYVSVFLGFIIGFWGVCGTLILNSSWRHAYFRFLNDIKDWAYVTAIVNMAKLQRNRQN